MAGRALNSTMTISPLLNDHGIYTLPPTQAELPYDDGELMETQRHKVQNLLRSGMPIPQVAQTTGLLIDEVTALSGSVSDL